jgi:LPXTG-motif cell wall-anchored protein
MIVAAESGGVRVSTVKEGIVRNPVRKFVGIAVLGLLGALFAVPMLSAGAQQVQPTAGTCTFNVTGTSPNFVVSGTAPASTTVTLYFAPDAGGVRGAVGSQPGPAFSFPFAAPSSGNISVGYVTTDGNAYTAECATVDGLLAVHVEVAGESVAVGPLAFTGSSNTPSYVLIGVAAVVLGAVLVVAARRRSQVS